MKMLYQIEKSTINKRFKKRGCLRVYHYFKIDKIAMCEQWNCVRNIVSND